MLSREDRAEWKVTGVPTGSIRSPPNILLLTVVAGSRLSSAPDVASGRRASGSRR
jgi:hypothetical protein